MKEFLRKWNHLSLILRIFIGLVIGVALGLAAPQATAIGLLGTIFVNLLKAVAPVLVFVLVISSLAQAKGGTNSGNAFRTVVFLYMLSTFLAAFIAVIGSSLFPVTIPLSQAEAATQAAPSGIVEVLQNLLTNMVTNPIASIINGNYVGILTWAIIFGLALKKVSSEHTKESLRAVSDAVSLAVKWIINLAPFGILGLVYTSVASEGLDIFTDYGKLLAVLVGCMLFMALIIDPFIVFICLRQNPYPLVLRCFKESGLTAFFTRSSAANIPVNMTLCEKLGLDKNIYSVSIPLGATINMDGAAITITVMTLATAHTMGIAIDIPTAIILSVLSALGACGASGVAGGSLLLIPMACSLFGISADIAMQVVGVGFIIGIIQDSLETAINSSGDVIFASTAEFMEWKKQGKEVKF